MLMYHHFASRISSSFCYRRWYHHQPILSTSTNRPTKRRRPKKNEDKIIAFSFFPPQKPKSTGNIHFFPVEFNTKSIGNKSISNIAIKINPIIWLEVRPAVFDRATTHARIQLDSHTHTHAHEPPESNEIREFIDNRTKRYVQDKILIKKITQIQLFETDTHGQGTPAPTQRNVSDSNQ